jgi:hypothetical protein
MLVRRKNEPSPNSSHDSIMPSDSRSPKISTADRLHNVST